MRAFLFYCHLVDFFTFVSVLKIQSNVLFCSFVLYFVCFDPIKLCHVFVLASVSVFQMKWRLVCVFVIFWAHTKKCVSTFNHQCSSGQLAENIDLITPQRACVCVGVLVLMCMYWFLWLMVLMCVYWFAPFICLFIKLLCVCLFVCVCVNDHMWVGL